MKRLFLILVGLVLVILVPVLVITVMAPDLGDLPPPDPHMPITLPDGGQMPLADLVERVQDKAAAPEDLAREAPADVPEGERPSRDELRREFERRLGEGSTIEELMRRHREPPGEDADLFALAEWARQEGRLDEAEALYRSVPRGHHQWERVQRRLGWHLYADERGEPWRGVPHVNAALAADPFDDNAWQDAARVYLSVVGMPVD